MAFARRSWKRAVLLVPKPKRRITALVDVKLPLDTLRNEMSSPYSLNGVSKRPSFIRPQRSCDRPTHESRCANAVLLLSTRNWVSSWKIAFRPPPRRSWPRTPKRELLDSISVRVMIALLPCAAPANVAVAALAAVAPLLVWRTSSG